MFKTIVKKALIRISGNNFSQKLLSRNILVSQYLMGIGSGTNIKNSGEYAIFEKLKTIGNSSYCIFDVGANKGGFAELVLSQFCQGGSFTVHCFEPSKFAFQKLYHIFGKNPHFVLNNFALGKEKGEFDLFYPMEGSTSASLTKREADYLGQPFSKSEKVVINTIDNYCLERNILNIDHLKIDVEGHEFAVLLGAQRMLKNGSIKMISFEFGAPHIDSRFFVRDFYIFLTGNNMKLYRITPSEYLCPISSYNSMCEQFRTTNFLAINNEFVTN